MNSESYQRTPKVLLVIIFSILTLIFFWQSSPVDRRAGLASKDLDLQVLNRNIPSSVDRESVEEQLKDSVDDGKKLEFRKDGKYDTLADAILAARHGVEKIDPNLVNSRGSEFFADNPSSQLRAWFSAEGVELASGLPPRESDQAAPWQLALKLSRIGRDGVFTKVSAGTLTGEGNRVEVQHTSAGITQWFVNGLDGLEQGFTLHQPPGGNTGKSEIELLLSVGGSLQATAMDQSDRICFVNGDGGEVIHYTGLKAWDSTGRTLSARLEGRGQELAIHVADAGAQYPVFVDPLFVNVEERLKPDSGDVRANANFGISVSISGDRALVGSHRCATTAGSEGGKAFVFLRTGSLWNLESSLIAQDTFASQWFGFSVSISGTTALVGAPKNRFNPSLPATVIPAAYVFVRNSATSTWSQQQKILEPGFNSTNQSLFGFSVGLSEDTALVGAPYDTGKKGSAYFFKRNVATWSQQGGKIVPVGVLTGQLFGHSVALSGESALIGMPAGEAGQDTDGFVHVYVRSGTNWNSQRILSSPEPKDRFGWSVALSGNTALVGAPSIYFPLRPGFTTPSFAPGSAYAFSRTGTVWNFEGRLSASDGVVGDVFGWAVAVSDSIGIVGSPYSISTSNRGGGLAYFFEKNGSVWNEQRTVSAGIDSTNQDQFGEAVAISENLVVIGASQDDTTTNNSGSAYTFQLGKLPEITVQPLSQTVVPGQSVTMTVTVTGQAPFRFQWRKNGSLVPLATNSSYTISSAQLGDQGNYDCVVSNIGGVVTSAAATLGVNALSQFAQMFPSDPPDAQGFVLVSLAPSGVGGWRFAGEQQWRPSGIIVSDLTTGDRTIEFRPVPGFIQPPAETVSVISDGTVTSIARAYFETPTNGSGALSVSLKPTALAAITVPQATRAQWRLVGENDTQWRDSDTNITGLSPGSYLIESKPVPGRTTPPTRAAVVQNLQTTLATFTYFLTDSLTGTPPNLVPFETVTMNSAGNPYTYVGQIRSNVGSSSGFVVKRRVVATAAHVVFDDGTLSAVTGLQWLFQRDRGNYEPKPQIPRGFHVLSGYALQRTMENTPGSSLPASQTLDVAALYFFEDAGRAGFGGFLASDSTDNEFLRSSAQKTLVGYPVDGISSNNQGRMHATPSTNVAFTRAFGRTFTTPDIRSSGGMSGGPMCVQFENGSFYPAAIYLGGTGQTVVRSIDSEAILLFTVAEVSGNGGNNNTGGGATLTGVTNTGTSADPGAVIVTILPAAANSGAGGARWRLAPVATFFKNGDRLNGLSAGNYILQLTSVSGFREPVSPEVVVTSGQLKNITFTYEAATALDLWRQANFQTTSNFGDAADGADPDKDGQNNLSEFAADTNPNNASDVFKILTVTKSATTFTVNAAGKTARSYILERSITLSPNQWSAVASFGPLAGNGPVALTDPAAPAGSAFYRLRVTAP